MQRMLSKVSSIIWRKQNPDLLIIEQKKYIVYINDMWQLQFVSESNKSKKEQKSDRQIQPKKNEKLEFANI